MQTSFPVASRYPPHPPAQHTPRHRMSTALQVAAPVSSTTRTRIPYASLLSPQSQITSRTLPPAHTPLAVRSRMGRDRTSRPCNHEWRVIDSFLTTGRMTPFDSLSWPARPPLRTQSMPWLVRIQTSAARRRRPSPLATTSQHRPLLRLRMRSQRFHRTLRCLPPPPTHLPRLRFSTRMAGGQKTAQVRRTRSRCSSRSCIVRLARLKPRS